MVWIYLLLALLAGTLMPVQAGVNSQLARFVGHPVLAAFVSFVVGTLGLFVYSLYLRSSWPTLDEAAQAPWWAWTGGFMGAFFVTAAAALAPRLGAATLLGLAITGQMIVSLVMDHYGLLGFPVRPLNGARVLGAILLLLGVALIRRF